MAPVVALIGLPWDSPLMPAGVDHNVIKAGLAKTTKAFEEAGYNYTTLYITPEDGKAVLTAALKEKHYDAIVIGFGIRGTPPLTEFFEELVNTIVEVSPKTKLAFNSNPQTTLEAAQRVAPMV